MFHVFAYETHYPSGGIQDYIGTAENLDGAKAIARAFAANPPEYQDPENFQIVAQPRDSGVLSLLLIGHLTHPRNILWYKPGEEE